jgi:hypothetical protein
MIETGEKVTGPFLPLSWCPPIRIKPRLGSMSGKSAIVVGITIIEVSMNTYTILVVKLVTHHYHHHM